MQLTFEKDEVILKFPRDLLSEGYVQDFFQRLKSEISSETGIPEDIRKEKELFSQAEETKLDDEQKELLDLLNYTIDSGRGDFAEQHDRYLYGNR